jgi:molybdate transport system ATP-binding protein
MCIVHHGKTLVSASPDEVMHRPPNVEVARLVGLGNIFDGTVIGHDEAARVTRLGWNGTVLECALDTSITVGERVNWVIPSNRVLLHQRVRPSKGERENPLFGEIVDLVALGETCALELRIEQSRDHVLSFSVPLHVAERNSLAVGDRVGVSLKSEGIHLMRREPENR